MTLPTAVLELAARVNQADSATLTYDDGSWVVLTRDTTGASRWQFRAYNPANAELVAQGTLTAEGVTLFLSSASAAVETNLDEPPAVEPDPDPSPKAGRKGR